LLRKFNRLHYLLHCDFEKDPSQKLPEVGVIKNEKDQSSSSPKKKGENETALSSVLTPTAVCVGAQLRTYRLAVACTGEYAVAATGSATPTMAQTLAKIVISVNRVDGVYETEVAVRMVLVATETNVVFTTASTDPFTGNNNANTLINESQSVITNTIGSANFDIGHTFSTGGGGLAGLGVVCQNSQKASGITGSPSPVGDPYDIDYVAHEVGHELAEIIRLTLLQAIAVVATEMRQLLLSQEAVLPLWLMPVFVVLMILLLIALPIFTLSVMMRS